jgi:signal transduction histidine kinase/CheY-like chemotaxis protein
MIGEAAKMNIKNRPVNTNIFLPIVLVIVLLLVVFVVSVRQFHYKNIHKKHVTSIRETSRLFEMEIDDDANLMNGILDFLKLDKTLQSIWLAKDRQTLLDYVSPIFEDIKSNYRVTHFYFHGLEHLCFLRVHNPSRHGDRINRHTMAGAVREDKPFYGIELGPLGTFTLRVVHPWYIEGRLSGYIELGQEIAHITRELHSVLGCHYIFVIQKSFLDRAKWEEGLRMIGKIGEWDKFAGFVVVDSTMEEIPSGIDIEIQRHFTDHDKYNFDISSEQRYLGGFVPLHDVGGTEVGDIVVLNDISNAVSSGRMLLTFLIVMSIVIGALLCGFFYLYIGRVERKLTDTYASQRREIVRRKQSEERLNASNQRIRATAQQLEASNQRLKSEIIERQKVEEKLKQAKIAAEAASESKGEFLANMSHEIRTPMNAIIGFGDILGDEGLTGQQEEYVNIIRESGTQLLKVIDDILDFSKIEAGKLDIEKIECSIRRLFALVESIMRPLATEKGLKFEVREIGCLPDNILTDSKRLQQCLVNIIGNAIKFTETGHVYVNVSLEDKDEKQFICFDVEDTGIGVPFQKQKKIFESFSQADGSTSRKYGGAGLGLAITRQLAELLGGELALISEEGKGSTFSLIIPVGIDATKKSLEERYNTTGHANLDNGKSRRPEFAGQVLVAEDVRTSQILAKSLLNKMGLEITIAEDGSEAVNKALAQEFSLILMDIQMPNMNGYEATKELRRRGITTPIIAVTAHALKGEEQKCVEAGCDDYLPKPLDRHRLQEKLRRYLQSKVEA